MRPGSHYRKYTASPRIRPPVAAAPFDEKTAREYQEVWAKYLRVPVEATNSIGMKMVFIPPGEFTMGEGRGARTVDITKAFYLGKYEVTQEEWEAVMGKHMSNFQGPRNPVEGVSWEDCRAFVERLNKNPGGPQKSYRKRFSERLGAVRGSYALPTEAQWEYACRAGSTGGYSFGDAEVELDGYGWYENNSERRTHPVGEKKPNAWGLFDMHGNVLERCADWYDRDYYTLSPGSDPTGPSSGSDHVIRGGGFSTAGVACRSASRGGGKSKSSDSRFTNVGLRVCLVLVDK